MNKPLQRLTTRAGMSVLTTIAFALLAFSLAWKHAFDIDVWWHLAAGRWIAQAGAAPSLDPFSFTYRDHPWTSITWGYEILIHALYQSVGAIWSVSLFHALVAAGSAALIWRCSELIRKPTSLEESHHSQFKWLTTIILFVIGFCFIEERWITRPEVLSQFFGCAFLLILTRQERGAESGHPGRAIFLLPLLQLFWVNTHGLFLFGPILAGLFAAARFYRVQSFADSAFRRFAAAALLTGAACFLNPRGLQGVLFPVHLLHVLSDRFYRNTIVEAVSPLQGKFSVAKMGFILWGLLFAATLTESARKIETEIQTRSAEYLGYPLWFFPWFGALFWSALQARRNVSILVLWTLPWIARAVSRALEYEGANFINWIKTPPALTLSKFEIAFPKIKPALPKVGVALPLLAALAAASNFYPPTGAAVRGSGELARSYFAERGAEFLRKYSLSGPTHRAFASVEFADYALYNVPGYESYIDGRFAELYPMDHVKLYMRILAHPALINEEAKVRGFNLVAMTLETPLYLPFVNALAEDPAWRPIFLDEVSVIFARKGSIEDGMAPSFNFQNSLDEVKNRLRTAEYVERESWWASPFRLSYERSFEIPLAFDRLANVLLMLGQLEAAEEATREALTRNPDFAPAWASRCRAGYIRCETAGQTGNHEINPEMVAETEKTCLQAVAMGQDLASSYQSLGLLYLNTGRVEEATRAFAAVIRNDPMSYEGQLMKGEACARKGDAPGLNCAVNAYIAAAGLRPYSPEAPARAAEIFLHMGRTDEAIRALRHVESIAPSPELHKRIETLSRKK